MALKEKVENCIDYSLIGLGCLAGIPVMALFGIMSCLSRFGKPSEFEEKMKKRRTEQQREWNKRVLVLAKIIEENPEKFMGLKYQMDFALGSFYNTGDSFHKIVNPETEPGINYCELYEHRKGRKDEKGRNLFYVRPSSTYGDDSCVHETTSEGIASHLLREISPDWSELLEEIRNRTGRDLEAELEKLS